MRWRKVRGEGGSEWLGTHLETPSFNGQGHVRLDVCQKEDRKEEWKDLSDDKKKGKESCDRDESRKGRRTEMAIKL